jgi:hypothetical protein
MRSRTEPNEPRRIALSLRCAKKRSTPDLATDRVNRRSRRHPEPSRCRDGAF